MALLLAVGAGLFSAALGGYYYYWGDILTSDKGNPVFGVPLSKVQKDLDNGLPLIISIIIPILKQKEALTTEGIFRVNGSRKEVVLLQEQLNKTPLNDIKWNDYDVYTVADILKFYLRNLPEPIFPQLDSIKLDNDESFVKDVKKEFNSLPEENKVLIRTLIKLLRKIANKSEQNKMSDMNLGMVFGPVVVIDRNATPQEMITKVPQAGSSVARCIEMYEKIF